MKQEIKARYPVSADVVLKMFSDKNFHTRKLEVLGLPKYQVLESAQQGDEFRIKIERKVPLEAPGMVKKVVPVESTVVSEERWNRKTRSGVVNVQPQGIPVKMSCTATVKDEGAGSVVTYVWDVSSSIPMIGGQLEKFVCSDMVGKSADEAKAAISLVDQYK